MKRAISFLAITVLMVTAISVTTFARGGCGTGFRAKHQQQSALCPLEGCGTAGPHQHGDSWYCSQMGWQGDYAACTTKGCTELGIHKHDGVYYHCANYETRQGCGGKWRNM